MKYISNEYTQLTKGDETLYIIPGQAFESLPAGFKVWSECTIKDESGAVAHKLYAGSETPEIKNEALKPKKRKTVAKKKVPAVEVE